MKNNNFDQMTPDIQATFENWVSDFTVNEKESNNWEKNTLKVNESAKIVGVYTPSAPGKKKLKALFTCNEKHDPIEIFLQTEVIQVQLIGEIIKGLPEKVVVNSEHEIELLVKNISGLDATQIDIQIGRLLDDTISISEEDINKNNLGTYTLIEFNEKTNKKLDTNKQYRIKGTYKAPKEEGNDPLDFLIKYNESQSLKDTNEKMGLSFNTLPNGSTTVISIEDAKIKVTSIVKPEDIPTLKVNQKQKIEFQFTNADSQYPITGIHITVTESEG